MHDPKNLQLPATRPRAVELGFDQFYTGSPCKEGHLAPRATNSGNCVICAAIKGKGKTLDRYRGRSSIRSVENHNRAQKAYDLGLNVYVCDSPCPQGHYERYVSSNNCVKCNNNQSLKRKEKVRWSRIEKVYGLSRTGYDQFYADQRGCCAICYDEMQQYDKNVHIDHCHASGKVRGLLCSKCNQAIGLLRESATIINSALDYIRRHNEASQVSG